MSTSLMYAPRRILTGFLAGVLALAGLAVAASPASAADATRVFGETRVQTSIETALDAHPGGVDTVILATSAVAADSLPGNGLAGALDAALLLTEPDDLNPDVVQALQNELTPNTVILLGGTAALSADVEADVAALGYTVDRIGGADRYETSALIAEEIAAAAAAEGGEAIAGGFGGTTTVLVTRGDLPFDAVAASSLSYHGPHPVLLTQPDVLSDEVAEAITTVGADQAVILGGRAAVSPDVREDVEDLTGATRRIAGDTRNETAAELATALLGEGFDVSTTYIATGAKPFDSLTAGQLAGQEGDPSPILLTAGTTLSEATTAFLETHAADIDQLVVFGGAGAVPDDVVEAAIAASGGAPTTFEVTLSWVNEVNDTGAFGNGEPGATGTATVTLDPAQDEIDFSVDYSDVTGPFELAPGFHIHQGALTENGPIVVTLATGAELQADDDQMISGTVTADEVTEGDLDAIIDDILANPEGYYLNLHSNDFPGGAIRGQLPDGAQDEVYAMVTEAAEGDAFSGEVLFVDTENDIVVIDDEAGAVTGLARLSYGDGDTFLYQGADSSLADFEQALSVGDVVDDAGSVYSTTEPNTFNLAVDADDEVAPTATGATFTDGTTFGNNATLDELRVTFDEAVDIGADATVAIDADADGEAAATIYTCGTEVTCTEDDADSGILVVPTGDVGTVPDVNITDGVSVVTVSVVTDSAGNEATGFPVVITIPDTTAPTLEAGGTADAPAFVADEELDEATVELGDVTIDSDGETVDSVTLDTDGQTILVAVSDPLEEGESVTLAAGSVADLAGNAGPDAAVAFTVPDTTAPTLQAGGTADAPAFVADEELDVASLDVTDVTTSGDETVMSIDLDVDGQTVLVTLSDPLEAGDSVTLTAGSVADLAGNAAPGADVTFTASA